MKTRAEIEVAVRAELELAAVNGVRLEEDSISVADERHERDYATEAIMALFDQAQPQPVTRQDGVWPSLPAVGVPALVWFRAGRDIVVQVGSRDRDLYWRGCRWQVSPDAVVAWMSLPK